MNNISNDRQIRTQDFYNVALVVPAAPLAIPLSAAMSGLTNLAIDSLIISVHPDAAEPVYFGRRGVTAGVGSNGMPIVPGAIIQLSIDNERPLYEVQGPLVDTSCLTPLTIPLIVWNINDCWLTSTAGNITAVVLFFPQMNR